MTTYFKSSLLEGGEEIPEGHYADDNMKSTVVPFRNGIMLSIAVGIAESNGLKYVMMANHGGDHTIYPDCRPEFVDAFDKAAASTIARRGRVIKAVSTIVASAAPVWSVAKPLPKRVSRMERCMMAEG